MTRGVFSIDCCDSSENDPFKRISLLFKVLCVYCNSLKMPNVVEYNFRGVEFYWTAPKFRRRKFRSSCVYIEFIRPPSNVPEGLSSCSRTGTDKELYKTVCCTCTIVVLLIIKPLAFLTFSLPPLSSLVT